MNWNRYRDLLEPLPPNVRDRARVMATRLVTDQGYTQEDAVHEAVRYWSSDLREDVPRVQDAPDRVTYADDDIASDPDFSLAQPHGPEGESHGGRGGLDPLQYAKDLAPELDEAPKRRPPSTPAS